MPDRDIHAQAVSSFDLYNVTVEASLLGRRHKFVYEGKTVNVSLPTKREIDRSDVFQDGEADGLPSKGYKAGSSQKPNDPTPIEAYKVAVAIVKVDIPDGFRVSKRAAHSDGRLYQSMTKSEQKRVHDTLEDCGETARRAFQFWLRIFRWKSRSGLIGRPATENLDEKWGLAFVDAKTGEGLGFGIEHMTLNVNNAVTLSDWKAIHRATKAGKEPPVWCELIFEGETAQWNGNLRGAALYYAIACETYLRSQFLREIPRKPDANVTEVIENHINVRPILRWYRRRQPGHLKKPEWSTVQKLMEMRNQIAHKGASVGISPSDCAKYLQASRALISW